MKISNFNIIKNYEDKVLIYNSYSKASIFLEVGSDVSMFENIDSFNALDEDDKQILIENGFVVNDDRDEISEIKYIFEQKYFATDILNIVLVPSLLCNFKCPYCCEKDFQCGKEDVKKYFKTLKEYAKKHFHLHPRVHISLFGGEPLIYAKECLDFLDWVKKDAKKNNYDYVTSVVTNGSLLDLDMFLKIKSHNLLSLQITIDSDKKNHDTLRIFKSGKPSFDLLMEKIDMVASNITDEDTGKFVVRINLNNTSVERVKEALENIDPAKRNKIYLLIRAIYNTHAYNENNCNSVSALQEYFDMGTELGFNIMRDRYSYQTCEACADRKFFYLMPDLTIWKCINDIGFKDSKIGKISENGIIETDPKNVVDWYKNCMSAFSDSDCLKCKMLPDCLGGCPLNKAKNGKKACRPFDMICLPYIY